MINPALEADSPPILNQERLPTITEQNSSSFDLSAFPTRSEAQSEHPLAESAPSFGQKLRGIVKSVTKNISTVIQSVPCCSNRDRSQRGSQSPPTSDCVSINRNSLPRISFDVVDDLINFEGNGNMIGAGLVNPIPLIEQHKFWTETEYRSIVVPEARAANNEDILSQTPEAKRRIRSFIEVDRATTLEKPSVKAIFDIPQTSPDQKASASAVKFNRPLMPWIQPKRLRTGEYDSPHLYDVQRPRYEPDIDDEIVTIE